MSLPTVKVEIGFASAALDDPQTWTDVSSFVRSVSTNIGRSTELDSFSPGTASIVLDNRTRVFDPEYAAGAHYGQLESNKAVRITCTYSAVTYPLFYGYTDGWPQTYNGPTDGTVVLACTDGFKLLGKRRLPESVYAYEVKKDAPKVWLGLGEGAGPAIDKSGNGYDGVYNGNETAVAGLIDKSSDGATTFGKYPDASSRVAINNTASVISALPWAVEFWVLRELGTDGGSAMFQQPAIGSSWTGNVQVESYTSSLPGAITGVSWFVDTTYIWTGNASATPVTYGARVDDGKPHHVVYKRTATEHKIYVDGVEAPTTTGTLAAGTGWYGATVIGAASDQTLDEMALYNIDLSAARIAAHYAAGVQPWVNDATGTRLGRILDVVGWPSSLRSIDTGEKLLGAATLASRTTLDYAQALEQTEQGRLFIAADGKLTFHSADHDLVTGTSTASQATFTDDGSGVDYLLAPFQFSRDDRFVFDAAQVTRDNGGTLSVGNPQTAAQVKSLSVMVRTDAEARNIGESFVSRYKTAQTRIEAFAIRPNKKPANWPTVLGLAIGNRVTLKRTPQKYGAQINKDFLLQGISHTITPGDWVMQFTASPTDPTSYFRWDSSLLDGTDVLR